MLEVDYFIPLSSLAYTQLVVLEANPLTVALAELRPRPRYCQMMSDLVAYDGACVVWESVYWRASEGAKEWVAYHPGWTYLDDLG